MMMMRSAGLQVQRIRSAISAFFVYVRYKMHILTKARFVYIKKAHEVVW